MITASIFLPCPTLRKVCTRASMLDPSMFLTINSRSLLGTIYFTGSSKTKMPVPLSCCGSMAARAPPAWWECLWRVDRWGSRGVQPRMGLLLKTLNSILQISPGLTTTVSSFSTSLWVLDFLTLRKGQAAIIWCIICRMEVKNLSISSLNFWISTLNFGPIASSSQEKALVGSTWHYLHIWSWSKTRIVRIEKYPSREH